MGDAALLLSWGTTFLLTAVFAGLEIFFLWLGALVGMLVLEFKKIILIVARISRSIPSTLASLRERISCGKLFCVDFEIL
jgi:hypothetical protein